jgi:hypothetical protein
MLDENRPSAPPSPLPAWKERPNWYVTNGDAVIGPVNTNLLLRGVFHGRVREECYIAQHAWSNWREQTEVREIAALQRCCEESQGTPHCDPIRTALRAPRVDTEALDMIIDGEALVRQALKLAVTATQANVGIVHRPRMPHVGLVTSWAHGPGMGLNLGEVVPWNDDARVVASRDDAMLGDPEYDVWARASARRLSSGLQRVHGVAVVSVRFGPLRGLIELGRYDHQFRKSDLAVLEDVQSSVSLRLGQLTD